MNMKYKKKFLSITATALIILFTYSSVGAHPGRTDSSGGHNVRTAGWGYKVGSYHYHSGTSNSKAVVSNSSYTSNNGYSSNTKEVQQKLNELGYSCGAEDGIMGTKTRNAIKKFQRDTGLTVDGIVGKNTNKSLFK
jgi:hypothetical protein